MWVNVCGGVGVLLSLLFRCFREYPVHRLLLSYASEYFSNKFDSLPPETTQLKLDGPFSNGIYSENNNNNTHTTRSSHTCTHHTHTTLTHH